MRFTSIFVALAAAALIVGCDRDPAAVPGSTTPSLDVGDGKCSVITTYYWDDGWVSFASWDGAYLPADLMIWFDAWNWEPEYPAFEADFDNIYAFGDIDLPRGLVDDFNDGSIDPIWIKAGVPEAVYEANGVLNIDIPASTSVYSAGLHTDYVVRGEFDVQIDFELSPNFYSLAGQTNAKLIITDPIEPPGGGYGFGAEVSVRGWGEYIGVELGPHGWFQHGYAETSDLAGKLRITRETLSGSECQLVHRPYYWSVHDLPWPGGLGNNQLQSVYPLDPKGDLVFVGGHGYEHSYVVFDLSSGSPVAVAESEQVLGYVLAAHSPLGSSVGFGGGRDMLVKYDGTFESFTLPCGAEGCAIAAVWARSPTDVWIADLGGKIWYWDGSTFEVEYHGDCGPWGIWGFPKSRTMFASGNNCILQRNSDGVWNEMEVPPLQGCGWLYSIRGIHPRDVWLSDFWGGCLLHFDGKNWSEVPEHHDGLGSVWPLDARELLWAGQGERQIGVGIIPIWGSVDGGQTWNQLQDPVFTQLQGGGGYSAFFAFAGTDGGTRVFAPTIYGGRLVIGSLNPLQSHVRPYSVVESFDPEELTLPEEAER